MDCITGWVRVQPLFFSHTMNLFTSTGFTPPFLWNTFSFVCLRVCVRACVFRVALQRNGRITLIFCAQGFFDGVLLLVILIFVKVKVFFLQLLSRILPLRLGKWKDYFDWWHPGGFCRCASTHYINFCESESERCFLQLLSQLCHHAYGNGRITLIVGTQGVSAAALSVIVLIF